VTASAQVDAPGRTGDIYGLFCPAGELRYIGQTRVGIRRRLSKHLTSGRAASPSLPVNRWIAKLLQRGQEPVIKHLVMDVPLDELDEIERSQIATARAAGARLLNVSDGGNAFTGTWRMPADAIRRSAEAKVGKPRSVETRAKLAAANRGKKAAPETCAKRSALFKGRTQSPEWVAKRVASIAARRAAQPVRTTCSNGHVWAEATTRWYRNGRCRACRMCERERDAARRAAHPKTSRARKPRKSYAPVRDHLLLALPRDVEITARSVHAANPSMTSQSIYQHLSKATKSGLLVRVRRGVYRLESA
jgi:hypothetical protein